MAQKAKELAEFSAEEKKCPAPGCAKVAVAVKVGEAVSQFQLTCENGHEWYVSGHSPKLENESD